MAMTPRHPSFSTHDESNAMLTQTTLYTGADGYARFREDALPLPEGTPAVRLSRRFPVENIQFRHSPVGFASEFHCTTRPQWTFILAGQMEIILRDGFSRRFSAGEGFYSNDLLPENIAFDPEIHGHKSRQVGDEALVTLFITTAGSPRR
ncbi:MAG: hypothetical protein LBF51_10445 [Zoogloeaceae bacterium]|nr:hypothetical protein [Zoogloeaceae bacterium]